MRDCPSFKTVKNSLHELYYYPAIRQHVGIFISYSTMIDCMNAYPAGSSQIRKREQNAKNTLEYPRATSLVCGTE